MCLQEVQENHYQEHLRPFLSVNGPSEPTRLLFFNHSFVVFVGFGRISSSQFIYCIYVLLTIGG